MKKPTYTEEQIKFELKKPQVGPRIGDVSIKMGISEATFYKCHIQTYLAVRAVFHGSRSRSRFTDPS